MADAIEKILFGDFHLASDDKDPAQEGGPREISPQGNIRHEQEKKEKFKSEGEDTETQGNSSLIYRDDSTLKGNDGTVRKSDVTTEMERGETTGKTSSLSLKKDSDEAVRGREDTLRRGDEALSKDEEVIERSDKVVKIADEVVKGVDEALNGTNEGLEEVDKILKNAEEDFKGANKGLKDAPKNLKTADRSLKENDEVEKGTEKSVKRDDEAVEQVDEAPNGADEAQGATEEAVKGADDGLKRAEEALEGADEAVKRTDETVKTAVETAKRGGEFLKGADEGIRGSDKDLKGADEVLQGATEALKEPEVSVKEADKDHEDVKRAAETIKGAEARKEADETVKGADEDAKRADLAPERTTEVLKTENDVRLETMNAEGSAFESREEDRRKCEVENKSGLDNKFVKIKGVDEEHANGNRVEVGPQNQNGGDFETKNTHSSAGSEFVRDGQQMNAGNGNNTSARENGETRVYAEEVKTGDTHEENVKDCPCLKIKEEEKKKEAKQDEEKTERLNDAVPKSEIIKSDKYKNSTEGADKIETTTFIPISIEISTFRTNQDYQRPKISLNTALPEKIHIDDKENDHFRILNDKNNSLDDYRHVQSHHSEQLNHELQKHHDREQGAYHHEHNEDLQQSQRKETGNDQKETRAGSIFENQHSMVEELRNKHLEGNEHKKHIEEIQEHPLEQRNPIQVINNKEGDIFNEIPVVGLFKIPSDMIDYSRSPIRVDKPWETPIFATLQHIPVVFVNEINQGQVTSHSSEQKTEQNTLPLEKDSAALRQSINEGTDNLLRENLISVKEPPPKSRQYRKRKQKTAWEKYQREMFHPKPTPEPQNSPSFITADRFAEKRKPTILVEDVDAPDWFYL